MTIDRLYIKLQELIPGNQLSNQDIDILYKLILSNEVDLAYIENQSITAYAYIQSIDPSVITTIYDVRLYIINEIIGNNRGLISNTNSNIAYKYLIDRTDNGSIGLHIDRSKNKTQSLYIENNKEKIKKYDKVYRKNNIYISRWRDILKSTLKRFDRKKTSSTQTTLGYSSIQLKEYLDKQGMDWDNHTIDHKVPLSWFKLSTPCSLVNALVNLQPLTLKENILKSNNFCSPVPTSYINQIKPYIKKQYSALLKVEEI